MLPPKEEGEAAHLYPENITPTPKAVQNFEIGYSSSTSPTPSAPSVKDVFAKCPESQQEGDESHKDLVDLELEEGSSQPGTPSDEGVEDDDESCCTSLVIIDNSEPPPSEIQDVQIIQSGVTKSEMTNPFSNIDSNNSDSCGETNSTNPFAPSSGGQVEVVEVLKNLENVKTPDPSEMDNSIVRASFVDFSVDDEEDNRSGISQDGRPLEEESGEDEDSKDFSLTLNPDLPKIRAQQIQNWLEFEKEQEVGGGSGNDHGCDSNEQLENSLEDGPNQDDKGNGSQDFELDSLSGPGGDANLTDAERRVRFLTDPHGNILISVYLTKLVQLILSILKLASAGYLDFTSSSTAKSIHPPPPPPDPSTISTSTSDSDCPSGVITANSDTNLNLLHDFPSSFACHYIETDEHDIRKNISGEGEEIQQQIQTDLPAQQISGDETSVIPGDESNAIIPEVIESQVVSVENAEPKPEVNEIVELVEEEVASTVQTDLQEKEPAAEELSESDKVEQPNTETITVVDEVKKVISVDPSLTNFDECEDTGSDSETLSTSSCSSMIEVLPKAVGEIEFIKEDDTDGNNNELKTDVIYLDDPDVTDKSITCYEFQPENEAKPTTPESDQPQDQVVLLSVSDTTLSASSVESRQLVSGEVATAPKEVPSVPESNKDPAVNLLKFNPIIDPEIKNKARSIDPNNNEGFDSEYDMMGDSPEEQLVSLCIEEEPISAVALTIAKWESFSKKQQQQVDAGAAAPTKGKSILPSYTCSANNGSNPGTPTPSQGRPISAASNIINNNNNNNNNNNTPTKIPVPIGSGAGPTCANTPNNGSTNNTNNGNTTNNNKTAAGWLSWNTSIKNDKTPSDDDEPIYAQPNSQAGSITTSLSNPSSILKAYPKPNSRGEIINWFKEGEIHRSGILLSYGQANHHSPIVIPQTVTSPVIVSWFFGLITRQQAEELLHGQPTGTFLVRISTRIWGYTLSYQSNNKTKHFLISAINPAVPATLTAGADGNNNNTNGSNNNGTPPVASPAPTGKQQLLFPFSPGGRYAFIGTNMTPYTTLASLIRHHSHAPITKAGAEKLLSPCPGGPKIAGIEYVFK